LVHKEDATQRTEKRIGLLVRRVNRHHVRQLLILRRYELEDVIVMQKVIE
jgi:hypothetical protein